MTTETTPIISPVLRYTDAPAAIEWLLNAFGFEKLTDFRTPDKSVAHADLRFGHGTIGVSSAQVSASDSPWSRVRQGLYVQVGNPDAFHDRAKAAGAEIAVPLTNTDYGSRDFSLRDPQGRLWGFGTYAMGGTTGGPTLWSELRYPDAAAAKAYLEQAIGFTTTLAVPASDAPGAPLMHVELKLGASVVMLGAEWPTTPDWATLDQVVHLHTGDPDALFARAKAAGAAVVHEPQDAPYGARYFSVRDPEGFVWWGSNYVPKG